MIRPLCFLGISSFLFTHVLEAQDDEPSHAVSPVAEADVANPVAVNPGTDDSSISQRLTEILETTGWYEAPEVRVEEGIVFLSGVARSDHQVEWAGTLAKNTEDVVAVVNSIRISDEVLWDLTPAWNALADTGNRLVRYSPLFLVAIAFLIGSWLLTKSTVRIAEFLLRRRVESPLLRSVISRAIAVPVFLIGIYVVLQISGLTKLAVTVLGGTGVLGLIVGFAFRDIAENFLASILLSIQRPFASGDRIAVAGYDGFVQSVNIRSTLLMTLDGNHVQIPNAAVYKGTITNFTANPNARYDFTVGIGYGDSITEAQSVALKILRDHPGVVDDPEPLVLVDTLGASTVNLRVYFWVDIVTFGASKVRSAIIRQIKGAYDETGISMPDEAREVVFPAGVPVQMIEPGGATPPAKPSRSTNRPISESSDINSAEGDLTSDAEDIQKQARGSRNPEEGPDLLSGREA